MGTSCNGEPARLIFRSHRAAFSTKVIALTAALLIYGEASHDQ